MRVGAGMRGPGGILTTSRRLVLGERGSRLEKKRGRGGGVDGVESIGPAFAAGRSVQAGGPQAGGRPRAGAS